MPTRTAALRSATRDLATATRRLLDAEGQERELAPARNAAHAALAALDALPPARPRGRPPRTAEQKDAIARWRAGATVEEIALEISIPEKTVENWLRAAQIDRRPETYWCGPSIRHYRRKAGLSLRAAAPLLGVSHQALGYWETTRRMTEDSVERVAAALGVTSRQLIEPPPAGEPELPEPAPERLRGHDCRQAIRTRRAELGLKQLDLARRLGVSRQMVNHWELRGRMMLANVERVAAALELTADELIERSRGGTATPQEIPGRDVDNEADDA